MSRIIVDEYPSEACECPLSRYVRFSSYVGGYKCVKSNSMCVIDNLRLGMSEEFIEEYGQCTQAFCRDYCRYLVDLKNI